MANDETNEDNIILKGDSALALWRQGKKVWDQWVEDNPVADVDFSNVDFSTEHSVKIDFSSFVFPNGLVSFRGANFGSLTVSFCKANFGNSDVFFRYARFSGSMTDFEGAKFGEGTVSFNSAKFGDSEARFTHVDFGVGRTSFNLAQFGRGHINFDHSIFSDGLKNFMLIKFGEGNVSFKQVKFSNGDTDFTGTFFGSSIIDFDGAQFGKGNYYFERATFKSHADFSAIINIEQITSLSFKGTSFEKTLDLSNNQLSCIIDLTATKITNQVSLEDLSCQLAMEKHLLIFNRAKDPSDIARLRRLKEIAENNADQDSALEFHANEMRAKRWHKNNSMLGLAFDYAFDIFSNYGSSELRPLAGLVYLWFLFSCYYFSVSGNIWVSATTRFTEALIFSGCQILPMVPGSEVASKESITILFFNNLFPLLHWVTFAQSLLSLMLLFLFGLALRNRFKL